MRIKIYSFILPGLLALAWIFTLAGVVPFGGTSGESKATSAILWMLFMAGCVLISYAWLHSIAAKWMAASIGRTTNAFQYQLAFVCLGLGISCFYATNNEAQSWVTVSIPVIAFFFLSGIKHIVDIVKSKDQLLINSLVTIWDLGMSISLLALLPTMIHATA